MELSVRLRAVADLVTEGASVADIGTDHGYIPIWLVLNGRSPRVTAMDINEGPLRRAMLHIREYKEIGDRVRIRQSDGLKNLAPGEADTIIAAGMGGGLIIRILEEGRQTADHMDSFILQPQSEISRVRKYLNTHGYRIVAENMVQEDGKYYPMMKAVHGEPEQYTEAQYLYGKRLLEEQHPVLHAYLGREKRIKEEIARRIRNHTSESARNRQAELETELTLIIEALDYYETERRTKECCAGIL